MYKSDAFKLGTSSLKIRLSLVAVRCYLVGGGVVILGNESHCRIQCRWMDA
jgi:hypothetical protein